MSAEAIGDIAQQFDFKPRQIGIGLRQGGIVLRHAGADITSALELGERGIGGQQIDAGKQHQHGDNAGQIAEPAALACG
jgi:hypothetical protein